MSIDSELAASEMLVMTSEQVICRLSEIVVVSDVAVESISRVTDKNALSLHWLLAECDLCFLLFI